MRFSLTLSQGRFGDVDPGFLRDWLIVLACLGGLVLLVATLIEKFRAKKPSTTMITPDPLRTQKVPEMATKAEVLEMTRRIERDVEELKREGSEAATSQEDRIVKIHNRVNAVAESLDFVRGVLEGIQRNQEMIMAKLLK